MITEAIKRLKYTIGNKNKPNGTDSEALNTLLQYISDIQKANVKSNYLFAKLYALYLTKMYREIKDIDGAIKVSYLALKMPLRERIELLSQQIKLHELEKYINTLTIDLNSEDLKEVEKCVEAEKEFWSVHEKAIFKKMSELWTVDTVTDHFYLTVNELLKDKELKDL